MMSKPFETFKENLFNEAQKAGFSDVELYSVYDKDLSIKAFEKTVEDFRSSEEQGFGFRGFYNNQVGYAYDERIDEQTIPNLIQQAKANALALETSDKEFMHDGSGDYANIDQPTNAFDSLSIDDKIELALTIEDKLLNKPHIQKVMASVFGESKVQTRICNTRGLNRTSSWEAAYYHSVVLAQDPQKSPNPKTGGRVEIVQHPEEIDVDSLVNEIHTRAVESLGAKSIESGTYPILFENRMVCMLLMQSLPFMLSAEEIQKGRSLLHDKLNQSIAASIITINDDPHHPKNVFRSDMDAEGIPTYKQALVKEGVLQTYFHNLKTAHKSGVKTTGHAHKNSYQGTVGIAPHNIVMEQGSTSLDGLMQSCGNGLFITELTGGINPVNGDFSMGAGGFRIEQGKKSYPVEQITLSGNFFDLFKAVQEIGNDTDRIMGGQYSVFSPSMLVEKISVGG